ncbi:BRI1 kinase inhibitor 1 [Ricinus communis]|uniref:BRI1 kinase inhibitor 1 n=1 Tax=Ricinus communis TaxID=3988 RepID=UPI0007725052|nr:BRI1 kinase inhibitor 1 [Ricinus communis]|eukprot:XP_015573922.1 BRI1 kinase inhibitor 1 [Ricinus communis]
METKQHSNIKEKVVYKHEEEKLKKEGKEDIIPAATKQQQQVPYTSSPVATTSPPSASSSPSHEFSFTISLHSSSAPVPDGSNNNKAAKNTPPSFAIDLSPADDIFFHGHLLPLHLLSHLPVSPRTSTNSLDSFTLPIRELLDDHKPIKSNNNSTCSRGNSSSDVKDNISNSNIRTNNNGDDRKARSSSSSKPKSFSLFGWRKGCEVRDKEDKDKQKKKLRFEVSQVLKRYVRMVRPLLFFKGRREKLQFHRQPYSFSGNLSWKNKQELRGRRGEYSAPASMRTSPTNSGLLVATASIPSSTSDSTMEELQAAIQAAIAHCKNSIAAEEKIKC